MRNYVNKEYYFSHLCDWNNYASGRHDKDCAGEVVIRNHDPAKHWLISYKKIENELIWFDVTKLEWIPLGRYKMDSKLPKLKARKRSWLERECSLSHTQHA